MLSLRPLSSQQSAIACHRSLRVAGELQMDAGQGCYQGQGERFRGLLSGLAEQLHGLLSAEMDSTELGSTELGSTELGSTELGSNCPWEIHPTLALASVEPVDKTGSDRRRTLTSPQVVNPEFIPIWTSGWCSLGASLRSYPSLTPST